MGRKNRVRVRLRCGRCKRPAPDLTSKAAENWNGKWENGRLALVLCPPCQTSAESAEAEINAAGRNVGTADGGQFVPDPVLCLTGTMERPGTVLYGRDHIQRIVLTGQAVGLTLIENLSADTRCVSMAGGVMIYLPRQRATQ
ncbi:hypothetical protein [Streptomyces sp. HUAS TT7]|uniref:hypothetical protein n=1 Tax=Streptomyces sp. HUAS TT7 TaxID=3447507 RepID=UPI003F658DFB